MDFKTSQKLYSPARINKYANACAGNKAKTMQLYRLNVKLSQRFHGILSLFEVILRNAINIHYISYFSDNDWIINQTASGLLLEEDACMIKDTENGFRRHGLYKH